jgi:hypothetical protein
MRIILIHIIGISVRAMRVIAPVLMLTVSAAHAAEPTVLERSGHWNVNYDDDSCSLLGTFGSGKDEITLQMSRFAPGDHFTLTLAGSPFFARTPHSRIGLDFGPVVNPQDHLAMNGKWGDKPMAIVVSNERLDDLARGPSAPPLPLITAETERAVRTLDITTERGKAYRLALGPMDQPMGVLRQCTDDLLKAWGLDPVVQSRLSRQVLPTTNPATWVTGANYPRGQLQARQMAIVRFRLIVDERGAPTSCHVQRATQGYEFAQITCNRITERARFEPALDAAGKPIASYFQSAVRFVIP